MWEASFRHLIFLLSYMSIPIDDITIITKFLPVVSRHPTVFQTEVSTPCNDAMPKKIKGVRMK
jgi:hypothetical protein